MTSQVFKLVREQTQSRPGGESYTLGVMYRNNVRFCQTCEDADRFLEKVGVKAKIKGVTAIPRGRYKLVTSMSHRFGKVLPEVLGVPGFSGIRLHGGNRAEDSEGCILVGKVRTSSGIAQCADVVKRIIDLIDEAADHGEDTYLEIV